MKKIFSLLAVVPCLYVCTSYADSKTDASAQWQDPKTGLTWLRCSLGQKWNGTSCEGRATQLNWLDANRQVKIFNSKGFAGKTNWRLPTIVELSGIRYCSTGWRADDNSGKQINHQLPSAKGLVAVPFQCASAYKKPTINSAIFPGVAKTGDSSTFWSQDADADNQGHAFGVSFKYGFVGSYYEYLAYSVRLVRDK